MKSQRLADRLRLRQNMAMARPWKKLRNLGPHGIKADEMFGVLGEIVKNGGTLKISSPSADTINELIPALPKGMLPNNLKLRYFLYTLCISSQYELGGEADPSREVAAKTSDICEEIAQDNPGYKIPASYDKRKRDAIIHVVANRERDVLSETFEQAVIDTQNILRFLKENRLIEYSAALRD